MNERPILFSAPMVQAILAGNKTQTRRVMKVQPSSNEHQLALCVDTTGDQMAKGKLHWIKLDGMNIHHDDGIYFSCPYGQIGDQLWVRETWGYFDPDGTGQDYESPACAKSSIYMMHEDNSCLLDYWLRRIAYKASFKLPEYGNGPDAPKKWHPSIHMPRWASRIQLEITNIRVERLEDISESDAVAEGTPWNDNAGNNREGYLLLWEQINGIGSWDANPWVWVIEFKRVEVQP